MKKIRKGTAVLLLLLSLCVPAVDVSADMGNRSVRDIFSRAGTGNCRM